MPDPGPSPFRYHLELTPAQLKLTHDALRTLAVEPGSDERTRRIVAEVLEMLPDEDTIAQIRLSDDGERAGDEPGPEPTPPDQPA
ncbi:MAG: hypothetical protein KJ006_01605 [Thermoleophilia bacterium]|nr:hypothetical protein [Thermoleophilia bacterium]GIK76967.1 MAG: hypothetical protein BroJett022_06570 [Actinomycetes bacterium]